MMYGFADPPKRKHSDSRCILVCIVFNVLLNSSSLRAEPDSAHEDKHQSTSILSLAELRSVQVTTPSKLKEKIRDTPGTVIVVTREQIQTLGYINLLQLLRELPGFIVHQYASETNRANVTHRGFLGTNKFLVLQDGIRITDPAGSPIPISDNFPLFHVKQIEVVYGPVSALYGADAFTGVINIITRKAEEIDGLNATVIGEFDADYNRVTLNFGKQINDTIAVVAGGHFHDAENPNLTTNYGEDFVFSDLTTFNGTTVIPRENRSPYSGETRSYSFYSKLELGEQFTVGGQRSYYQHPTSSGVKADAVNFSSENNWNTLLGSLYGKFEHPVNKQLSLMLQANHAYFEVRNDSKFVNIFTDFQEGFKYARSESNQFEIQIDYDLDPNNHVTAGFSYTDYYALPKTADLGKPYDTNEGPNTLDQFYPGTDNNLRIEINEIRYDVLGGFLQWRSNWSEQWLTTVGVRYDNSSTYRETINPRIGLVYKLFTNTTLKLLYGSAFLAPAPLFSYEHFGAFSGDPDGNGLYNSSFFRIPNPHLKPEKIDTYELHISHAFNNQLQWTAVPFYNTASDLIFGAPSNPQQPNFIKGGEIAFTDNNDNVGDGKSYGVDTWIDFVSDFANNKLKMTLNYNYLGSKLDIDGKAFSTPLPGTSRHNVKLIIMYTYKNRYTLSPRALWSDKTYSNKIDPNSPENILQVRGYTVVNLHAEAKLHSRLSVILDIENLFDKKYYNMGPTSSSGFVESPQNPRRVFLGVRYKF
jgi:outer membrane receptor for ferrienterochelin and colicin